MENAVMIGVLLAVVGVGLFGLYYVNTDYAQPTIYRPVPITGMGAGATSTASATNAKQITKKVVAGGGSSVNWAGNVELLGDAPQPAIFSSFNDSCNGCVNFTITSAPTDKNYGGGGVEYTMCGIINSSSNVVVNTSINQSTSGFTATVTATMAPYGTNTTAATTDDSIARDDQVNGTFDDTNALSFTSTRTHVVTNHTVGVAYDLACKWSFDSTQAAGTYVTTINYLGVEANP